MNELKIVPSKAEYAETFYRWRNQSASSRYNPLIPLTLEECRKNLMLQGSDLKDLWMTPSFRWFIERDGQLVANVSLKTINKQMLTAEIGYGVGEEFHGQGIGTQAVRLLIKKVFEETELRKLIAFVHEENRPSCKILENLGFTKEGLLREHFLINGVPVNEAVFGLLRREWGPSGV